MHVTSILNVCQVSDTVFFAPVKVTTSEEFKCALTINYTCSTYHDLIIRCSSHADVTNGAPTAHIPNPRWRASHVLSEGQGASDVTVSCLTSQVVALCSPAVHQWAVDKIEAKLPVFIYGKCLNNCVRYRLQVRNNSDGCFSSASVLGGD